VEKINTKKGSTDFTIEELDRKSQGRVITNREKKLQEPKRE